MSATAITTSAITPNTNDFLELTPYSWWYYMINPLGQYIIDYTKPIKNDLINWWRGLSLNKKYIKLNQFVEFYNSEFCHDVVLRTWAREVRSKRTYFELIINDIEDDFNNFHLTAGASETPTYKRKTIPKPLKMMVWDKYFPNQRYGRCFCCERSQIEITNFETGHILAVINGGENTLENLCPICSICNKSMNLQIYMNIKHYYIKNEKLIFCYFQIINTTLINIMQNIMQNIMPKYNAKYNA